MTEDEFNALPPLRQLEEIATALRDSGARCRSNMLTAGSWVETSFYGAAERLEAIYWRLANAETIRYLMDGLDKPSASAPLTGPQTAALKPAPDA